MRPIALRQPIPDEERSEPVQSQAERNPEPEIASKPADSELSFLLGISRSFDFLLHGRRISGLGRMVG